MTFAVAPSVDLQLRHHFTRRTRRRSVSTIQSDTLTPSRSAAARILIHKSSGTRTARTGVTPDPRGTSDRHADTCARGLPEAHLDTVHADPERLIGLTDHFVERPFGGVDLGDALPGVYLAQRDDLLDTETAAA
jgi:hypothetical protein